ncbi:hypothetical protein [Microbispora sp. H10885]|uniref:hypothetical protein n=1 Tax=Microbispora sp. H10885 TaxID=2729110 RepID=UPI001601013D|nr:hypothetical protein [Microbispora sp. H10885]
MIVARKVGVNDDSVHPPALWVPDAIKDDTMGTESVTVAAARLDEPAASVLTGIVRATIARDPGDPALAGLKRFRKSA